jgi:hypothetical protein
MFYCLRFEISLFVASYDYQGYGGGIRPHRHMELVISIIFLKVVGPACNIVTCVQVTLRLTVSQSVSQSWCQAQSGAHNQIFITV